MIAEVKAGSDHASSRPERQAGRGAGRRDERRGADCADPRPRRLSRRVPARPSDPTVKQLLTDKDLQVRQSVAAALTVAGEKDAVPVLIDLLAELPPGQTWPAQDVLHQLAGDKAPTGVLGDKTDERKKYREPVARLVEVERYVRRPVQTDHGPWVLGVHRRRGGRKQQRRSGRRGRSRRKDPLAVGNLKYPVDAVVLPGERVLVTEWDGNRVGEWDFRGNLIWKKDGFNGRATNAQRLPNGNTFICTTNELIEVDRNRQGGVHDQGATRG